MDAIHDDAARAPADAPPAYCRQCGYALHGLPGGRCPECGGAFDRSNPKTFSSKPVRPALRGWVWRISVVLVLLAVAAASVPGWYAWQWWREQRRVDALRAMGARVWARAVEPAGAGRYLPRRWAFLHDRAAAVDWVGATPAQTASVDFGDLEHLVELNLGNCHVNRATLAQIGRLRRLVALRVRDDAFDGDGLESLAGCRALLILSLADNEVGDDVLAKLAQLPPLTSLDLSRTRVTDAGVPHLAAIRSLLELNLSGTAVSNAGLPALAKLSSLKVLFLARTSVDRDGRRDFRRRMPAVAMPGY